MKLYKITYTLIEYIEADSEAEASAEASYTEDYGDLEDTCIEEVSNEQTLCKPTKYQQGRASC